MATLQCPRCDARFEAGDGLAKTAVSLLMPAPAVPDMASQVRCPNCGHVFGEGETRYLRAGSWPRPVRWLVALALVLVAWIGLPLLTR